MSFDAMQTRPHRFRLSVFQNGVPSRAPEILTRSQLIDALLHASMHDDARVNFVVSTVDELGSCEMINGPEHPKYLIERVSI